jgi:hypothetical protein
MQILVILATSLALVFGCSDSEHTGGTGGVAGSRGGIGGNGGSAGVGGSEAELARVFVLYSPDPPCVEGVESDYDVRFIGDTGVIQEIRGSSTQCTGFEGTENFTQITCDNDPAAIDFTLEVTDVEPVTVSGTFEACAGFYQLLGALEAPPSRGPFVDLVISPIPPCEEDVPSDYIVEFLVDSRPGMPENASVELSGCTGAIDSAQNTITCSNELGTYAYSIRVGEGEQRVEVQGQLESCTAQIFAELQ